MVWFDASVDDQAAGNGEVFVDERGSNAVNVHRWIAPRESDPRKVVQGARRKGSIIYQHNQRPAIDGAARVDQVACSLPLSWIGCIGRCQSIGFHAQDTRHNRSWIAPVLGQAQQGGNFARQLAARRSAGGDYQFRSAVEAVTRIIERIHCRPRMEMQIARPIDALQDMAEESLQVVNVQAALRVLGDPQVLGEGKLP